MYKRRLISFVLVMVMVLSITGSAFASSKDPDWDNKLNYYKSLLDRSQSLLENADQVKEFREKYWGHLMPEYSEEPLYAPFNNEAVIRKLMYFGWPGMEELKKHNTKDSLGRWMYLGFTVDNRFVSNMEVIENTKNKNMQILDRDSYIDGINRGKYTGPVKPYVSDYNDPQFIGEKYLGEDVSRPVKEAYGNEILKRWAKNVVNRNVGWNNGKDIYGDVFGYDIEKFLKYVTITVPPTSRSYGNCVMWFKNDHGNHTHRTMYINPTEPIDFKQNGYSWDEESKTLTIKYKIDGLEKIDGVFKSLIFTDEDENNKPCYFGDSIIDEDAEGVDYKSNVKAYLVDDLEDKGKGLDDSSTYFVERIDNDKSYILGIPRGYAKKNLWTEEYELKWHLPFLSDERLEDLKLFVMINAFGDFPEYEPGIYENNKLKVVIPATNAGVNLKVENGKARVNNKDESLDIVAEVTLENRELDREKGEKPVKVTLEWETEDGQEGSQEQFIEEIKMGETVEVEFNDDVDLSSGEDISGRYKIVVNPENENPEELNFEDNVFEGEFGVEGGWDFVIKTPLEDINTDKDTVELEVIVSLNNSTDNKSTKVTLYDSGGRGVGSRNVNVQGGGHDVVRFNIKDLKEGTNRFRAVVNSDYNLSKSTPVKGEKNLSNNGVDIHVNRGKELDIKPGACINGGITGTYSYQREKCNKDSCWCVHAGDVDTVQYAKLSYISNELASDTWTNDINGQRAYKGMPNAKDLNGNEATDDLMSRYGINPLKQIIRAGHGFEVRAVLTLKGYTEGEGKVNTDYKKLYEYIKKNIFVDGKVGKNNARNNEGKYIQEMEYDVTRAESDDIKTSTDTTTYGDSCCKQVTIYHTNFDIRIPVIIKHAQGYIDVLGKGKKVKVPNQRKWFTYLNDSNGEYQLRMTAKIDWGKLRLGGGVTECSTTPNEYKFSIYGTMFDLVNIDDGGGKFWDN